MATRKKSNVPKEEVITSTVEEVTPVETQQEEVVSEPKVKSKIKEPKYKIGDIVFVS